LLAIIKQNADEQLEVRVHPTLVPKTSSIASISGVFNGVMVNGDFVGDTLFCGRGAGREATASAVVGDIVDAALDLVNGVPCRLPAFREGKNFSTMVEVADFVTKCYMRIPVADKPGVLGKVATLLSQHGISVAKLMQTSADASGNVEIIILTHETKEGRISEAVKLLADMPEVTDKVHVIRMEDL
jgi:homoserine dehydrogenase